jgi:glycosyltransferase involved in cell wall biosynthesis
MGVEGWHPILPPADEQTKSDRFVPTSTQIRNMQVHSGDRRRWSTHPIDHILMIGTSPTTMGGIASVVKTYMDGGLFDRRPITYLTTHRDGSALVKLATLLKALLVYARWMVTKRRFLLHIHTSSRNSFWRKCLFIIPALLSRKPVILHLHGSEFMQFFERECGRLRKSIIRHVFSRCERVLVLSESWQRDVSRITSCNNLQVLKNPSPAFVRSARAPGRETRKLLFLGRLGRRKGIYVLLESLVIVRDRFPDVTLCCGGDGEIKQVKARVQELGLSDAVDVLGWVRGTEKQHLLETSTLFVLPSFDEGVPISILEAMSASLPIIATPVGGIPEVVRDGIDGILVQAGDSVALANAICQLFSDAALAESMGRNARERHRSEHGVESIVEQLERIYDEIGVL